jgi:hypothetical protein
MSPQHSTSATLTVTFVRKAGSPDHVYVRRRDGSETGWSFPSYGAGLPHDLVHLVVESHFGLTDGFWGRVASGIDAARVNADANRRGGKDKYAGFGDDLGELYLAEALANARWLDREATDGERLEDIARECAKASIPVPAALTLASVATVREKLADLQAQWARLVPRGALTLSFDRL